MACVCRWQTSWGQESGHLRGGLQVEGHMVGLLSCGKRNTFDSGSYVKGLPTNQSFFEDQRSDFFYSGLSSNPSIKEWLGKRDCYGVPAMCLQGYSLSFIQYLGTSSGILTLLGYLFRYFHPGCSSNQVSSKGWTLLLPSVDNWW